MKTISLIFFLFIFLTSCATTKNTPPDGFVKLSFDLNEYGEPRNIKVIDAEPKNEFDEAAIKELSTWKYKPKLVNGVATYTRDLTVIFDFRIEK